MNINQVVNQYGREWASTESSPATTSQSSGSLVDYSTTDVITEALFGSKVWLSSRDRAYDHGWRFVPGEREHAAICEKQHIHMAGSKGESFGVTGRDPSPEDCLAVLDYSTQHHSRGGPGQTWI